MKTNKSLPKIKDTMADLGATRLTSEEALKAGYELSSRYGTTEILLDQYRQGGDAPTADFSL